MTFAILTTTFLILKSTFTLTQEVLLLPRLSKTQAEEYRLKVMELQVHPAWSLVASGIQDLLAQYQRSLEVEMAPPVFYQLQGSVKALKKISTIVPDLLRELDQISKSEATPE
jgi:hypothetical protein